jgi:type I site-specific restriction-modification system R (restriction) subunit
MTTDLVPVAVEDAEARVAAVQEAVTRAREQAEAIEVRNEAEANAAGELLKRIAKEKRDAEAERKELVGPLNDTVKRINQKYKDGLAPYAEADQIVRQKVTVYTTEQERIRREEEDRLERERQEAERKAREERERQEAEARAKREQAEKEAREAAELERQAKDAADREAAEKLAAEARQAAEEAQTAESAIASLPEPELPKAIVPKAAAPTGTSTRKVWKVTAIDKAQVPAEFLVVDEKAIREAMRTGLRENGNPPEIPGVTFEQVPELAVRG